MMVSRRVPLLTLLVLGTALPLASPRAVGAQAPAPAPVVPPAQGTPAAPAASPAEPGAPTPPAPRPSGGAELPSPVTAGAPVALSLREAVVLTVANNLDLQVEALNPEIQATTVGREEAAFDPTLTARLEAARDRGPTGSTVQANDTRQIVGQAAVTQRLPLGTQYELSYNTDRLKTNSIFATINPSYTAQVLLAVTQPLLRGLGTDINRVPILVARGNERIARENFRSALIASIFLTVQEYWGLVQAREALDVARESLRLAERLLEQNRIQVQVGTLAPIEVTQAQAGVAARREDVIVAEAAARDAEDRLKRQVVVDTARAFDYTIVTTERAVFAPVAVQLAPNLEAAARLRPELAAGRERIQNAEATLRLARNQLLPELNLVGSAGLNGFDDGFGEAQSDVVDEASEQYQWSAGVAFSLPLGNRAARNAYRGQQLALRQAQTQLRSLDLQVQEEVRAAVRAVNTNSARVDATREAARLAREQLTAEERRLAVGLSTSFEVLRLQTDLAQARNDEITAVTDYRVSFANLDRVVGTLLERFDVAAKP